MKLPPPLSWLWIAWKTFGEILGKIMSKIILTILWIVGFGLYAIMRKVILLVSKKSEEAGPMWIDVAPQTAEDLHRQF